MRYLPEPLKPTHALHDPSRTNNRKPASAVRRRAAVRWLTLLLAALLMMPWGALAGAADSWTVYVTHDLAGGQWLPGEAIAPHSMTAKAGWSMSQEELSQERERHPAKAGAIFLGWSVRFTGADDGRVIYDSGEEIWDLWHPFDYYPDNPRKMNCRMTARWRSTDLLSTSTLPDGRTITWPFAPGTEPLPELPPPCDQIIPGTTWLTSVLICGMEEGTKAPVYAFPVADGPIMDWVSMDDSVDYGLYLFDGWVMLYHPKWTENAGIGFIAADVIAFPGCEE